MNMDLIMRKHLSEGRHFKYAWGIFLDEFYRSDRDKKMLLIDEKPTFSDDRMLSAFLAASVHKLCREYSIPVPRWVFAKETYLNHPYFPNDPPLSLRKVYLVESPPEFKVRNIFVSENTLTRV